MGVEVKVKKGVEYNDNLHRKVTKWVKNLY
jgi:hypothetical protein